MARAKTSESSRSRSKAASIEEVSRGIKQFQEFLDQVEDLGREGFPYLDAARARTELQLRECIRRHFGERSPEFQEHKHHRLLVGTPHETQQSIALIKSLIAILEDKKLDLQGLKPPAVSIPAATPAAPAKPQMTLVPPSAPTAHVTFTPAAPVMPPPVTMSIPLTTNLDMAYSTGSRQTTPQATPSPAPKSPATMPTPPQANRQEPINTPAMPSPPAPPVAAPPPAIPATAAHSDSQRFTVPVTPPSHAAPPAVLSSSKPAAPSTPAQAPVAQPEALQPNLPRPSNVSTRSTQDQTPMASTQPIPSPALQSHFPLSPLPVAESPSPLVSPPIQQMDNAQSALEFVKRLCHRFHAVARQLRLRGEYRSTLAIEDEFDVQDLFHGLLRLQFDDIGTDEWTPSYTEGSPRVTFLLEHNTLAVVVKKTRPGLSAKDLAEQFRVDADRYRGKHGCSTLLCFVYDPEGRIGNPRGLETDHSNTSAHFTTDILVAPK